MIILAFTSYDDFKKSKQYEAPFLEYLAAYGQGIPTLEFHEKGLFHVHPETKVDAKK